MSFLTNPLFWIILAAIIFILALIGYLTESKKKSDKKAAEVSNIEQPVVAPADPLPQVEPAGVLNLDNGTWSNEVPTAESVQTNSTDDWTVMPTVNSVPVASETTSQVPTPTVPVEPVAVSQPVADPVVPAEGTASINQVSASAPAAPAMDLAATSQPEPVQAVPMAETLPATDQAPVSIPAAPVIEPVKPLQPEPVQAAPATENVPVADQTIPASVQTNSIPVAEPVSQTPAPATVTEPKSLPAQEINNNEIWK